METSNFTIEQIFGNRKTYVWQIESGRVSFFASNDFRNYVRRTVFLNDSRDFQIASKMFDVYAAIAKRIYRFQVSTDRFGASIWAQYMNIHFFLIGNCWHRFAKWPIDQIIRKSRSTESLLELDFNSFIHTSYQETVPNKLGLIQAYVLAILRMNRNDLPMQELYEKLYNLESDALDIVSPLNLLTTFNKYGRVHLNYSLPKVLKEERPSIPGTNWSEEMMQQFITIIFYCCLKHY